MSSLNANKVSRFFHENWSFGICNKNLVKLKSFVHHECKQTFTNFVMCFSDVKVPKLEELKILSN